MDFRGTEDFSEDNLTGQNKSDDVKENTPARVLTAKTIIGDKVVNGKGENLGHIDDIMLSMGTGCIEYVVLSFGGFLGIGDKLFAIPWMALRLDDVNRRFVLNYDKEVFEKAPGFDKDHWPESNSRHMADVNTYWGPLMTPYNGGFPV